MLIGDIESMFARTSSSPKVTVGRGAVMPEGQCYVAHATGAIVKIRAVGKGFGQSHPESVSAFAGAELFSTCPLKRMGSGVRVVRLVGALVVL